MGGNLLVAALTGYCVARMEAERTRWQVQLGIRYTIARDKIFQPVTNANMP